MRREPLGVTSDLTIPEVSQHECTVALLLSGLKAFSPIFLQFIYTQKNRYCTGQVILFLDLPDSFSL